MRRRIEREPFTRTEIVLLVGCGLATLGSLVYVWLALRQAAGQ